MPKKSIPLNDWKPEQPPEQIVDQDDAEIDEVFADFPQNDACIELFRVNAQGGRPLYLEQVTPTMFSFAYVCEKYGGGRYFARGKYKDGSRVRLPFEIEGEPFPVKRKITLDTASIPTSSPVQFLGEPASESGASGETMVSLMRLMLSKMENNEEAFLRKMALYRDLFSAQKTETPIETAITMFSKGLEMAGNSNMAETNPWLMFAKEFKEPLGKIVNTV